MNKRLLLVPLSLLVVVLGVVGWLKASLVVPAAAPKRLWSASVEQAFEAGTFPEGVEGTEDAVVTGVSPFGAERSWTWSRGAGTRFGFGNTLARSPDGRLFITTHEGPASEPTRLQVRLEELVDGTPTLRARFPLGAAINGIAFGPDATLYAADSALGCIWSWTPGTEPVRWRDDPRFRPSSLPGIPGINGLRIRGETMWVVNSSSGVLYRLSLRAPEQLIVVATDLPGDGLDVAEDGAIFVATHPFNTIERVGPDGVRSTIADASLGVVGPTDVWALKDGSLLVVQDGGGFLDLLPAPLRLLFPSSRSAAALVHLRPHVPREAQTQPEPASNR